MGIIESIKHIIYKHNKDKLVEIHNVNDNYTDFEKTCLVALELGGARCICKINKTTHGYTFSFCDIDGKIHCSNPVFIRDNGESIIAFDTYEHPEEKIICEVKVPDRFKPESCKPRMISQIIRKS